MFILEGCSLISLFLRCGCFDLVSDLVTMGLSLEGCGIVAADFKA